MRVPLDALSPAALRGVVEEVVTREGTDYGEEVPLEVKVEQVMAQLRSGAALIVFDPETESCTILSAEEARARGL
jgi:uncharacterized protein YheU (UPF0270 family)